MGGGGGGGGGGVIMRLFELWCSGGHIVGVTKCKFHFKNHDKHKRND